VEVDNFLDIHLPQIPESILWNFVYHKEDVPYYLVTVMETPQAIAMLQAKAASSSYSEP